MNHTRTRLMGTKSYERSWPSKNRAGYTLARIHFCFAPNASSYHPCSTAIIIIKCLQEITVSFLLIRFAARGTRQRCEQCANANVLHDVWKGGIRGGGGGHNRALCPMCAKCSMCAFVRAGVCCLRPGLADALRRRRPSVAAVTTLNGGAHMRRVKTATKPGGPGRHAVRRVGLTACQSACPHMW